MMHLVPGVSLLLGLACLFAAHPSDARSEKAPGQKLAEVLCAKCHGVDGNSTSPHTPNLAAQPAPYLARQMRAFRNRTRYTAAAMKDMWRVSSRLTDRQIRELAEHYSKQALQAPPPPCREPQLLEAGKAIFLRGVPQRRVPPCTDCHGKDGLGNSQDPRIAGQHGRYVVRQLLVFRQTDQRPDADGMKAVARQLSLEQIAALAAYLEAAAPPSSARISAP
jgi:cytochrome c553